MATTLLTVALALAGIGGVSAAAGLAAAAGGFPDHLGQRRRCPAPAPKSWPPSVATPLEREFGRIAGVDRDDRPELVRPDQHRRCSSISTATSTRPAATSQAAINAARSYLPSDLPGNPTYRKVNPADSADHLMLRLTSDTLPPSAAVRCGLDGAGSSVCRNCPASGRSSSAEVRRPRCASTSIRTQVNSQGLLLDDVRTAVVSADGQSGEGQFERIR